ncbi:Uncharacterised protein [Staphylococcus agnetis]|nr:Uncharacterised protein [Staphylococcus agnetis]
MLKRLKQVAFRTLSGLKKKIKLFSPKNKKFSKHLEGILVQ